MEKTVQMPHQGVGRRVWLLLVLIGLSLVGTVGPTHAQGTTWDCPVPAGSERAASPTADDVASPVVVVPAPTFSAAGGDLTVFAAASLTDAFTRIAADITAAHPNVRITVNFAGSQALVTQLSEGATADVFASASEREMTAAIAAGLVTATPVTFVQNALVIVVPADNPAGIATAADLATDGLRLVVANPAVPVGSYSRAAVCAMAADAATFGDGFLAAVAGNVVSEEDDVREVLTKVTLGEADAGLVYVSDSVVAGDAVTRIEIPPAYNVEAAYPIAPLVAGNMPLAEAFIAYVLSDAGQAVLTDYGFVPVIAAP